MHTCVHIVIYYTHTHITYTHTYTSHIHMHKHILDILKLSTVFKDIVSRNFSH